MVSVRDREECKFLVYIDGVLQGELSDVTTTGIGVSKDLYLDAATSRVNVFSDAYLEDVVVSPNPFKDRLTVKLSERWLTEVVNISIYDLAGRLVLFESREARRAHFEMDGFDFLAKGMYTCVIQDGERMVAVKIMH